MRALCLPKFNYRHLIGGTTTKAIKQMLLLLQKTGGKSHTQHPRSISDWKVFFFNLTREYIFGLYVSTCML